MLSDAIGLKVDNLIDGDMLHPGLCYGADGSSPEVGASHLDSAGIPSIINNTGTVSSGR